MGRNFGPKNQANCFIFYDLRAGWDTRMALLLPQHTFVPATPQQRCLPRALPSGSSPLQSPDSAPLFRWSHQTATRATGRSTPCPPALLVPAARHVQACIIDRINRSADIRQRNRFPFDMELPHRPAGNSATFAVLTNPISEPSFFSPSYLLWPHSQPTHQILSSCFLIADY